MRENRGFIYSFPTRVLTLEHLGTVLGIFLRMVRSESPRSLPMGETSAVYAVRFVYREGRVVINNAQTVMG